jgi:ABC-type dipeptide/oligopeptide/nickel transport system permease component
MQRLLAQRAISLVFVLFSITFLTFLVLYLAPGDPVRQMMGGRQDPVRYEFLRHLYGLDKPFLEQYGNYLWKLLHGDLGLSYKYPERPVWDLLQRGVPVSLQLGMMALALSLLVGIPTGIYASLRQNKWQDTGIMALMLTLYSIPSFVLIPILWLIDVWLYQNKLPSLPIAGWGNPENYVMPVMVLAAASAGFIARLTRNSMLEVMRQDYVRTARAKGLRESTILRRHIFRNAMIPILTVLGPASAFLVTGAFVVENLFAIPGIGYLAVQSIGQRDYPVVLATTLLLAIAVVVMNLVTDIAYTFADPRTRET